MASSWTRVKMFYMGVHRNRIISCIIFLILLFLVIRWASTPPRGAVWEDTEELIQFQQLDDAEIKAYIDTMTDTRSESCKLAQYSPKHGNKVSIVLDFHEHQFYDLKMTLESILKHTPSDLYEDIILLDDGTGQEVRKEALRYLGDPRFKKLKAFRSAEAGGMSVTRFKAAKVATGNILVFLSSQTAVNQGWLQPLVDAVNSNRHLIAVPHFDNLLTGYRFFQIQDNLITLFNWRLSTLFMETNHPEGDLYLKTPIMTGDAFAVDKDFLESIGSFDETMDRGGGESLELSIRAWLCGGAIQIVKCSRVAIRNALQPHDVTSPSNFRRIAELWLDEYKGLAYRQSGISSEVKEEEAISLRTRKLFLKKMTSCMSFKQYMTNTANAVLVPPTSSRYFGKMKTKTGYCIDNRLDKANPRRVRMTHCRPHMYEPYMIFNVDLSGHIKIADNCIDIIGDDGIQQVSLVPCTVASSQTWAKDEHGMLRNSQHKDICLAHVSDPDTKAHYLGVKDCIEGDRSVEWTVIIH